MASDLVNKFNDYRTRMKDVILGNNHFDMKHLWRLDTNRYEEGAIDKKQKKCLALFPIWFCVAMII